MKNNLENSIKESLKDFEMPYDPKAWEALSSKLDAQQPTTAPKSNLKWYAIASTVVVATVATYFFLTHDQHSTDNKVDQIVMNDNGESNAQEFNENTVVNDNTSVSESALSTEEQERSEVTMNDNSPSQPKENTSGTTVSNNSAFLSQNNGNTNANNGNSGTSNEDKSNRGDGENEIASSETEMKIPVFNSICKGESIKLENVNTRKIWIITPSGEEHFVNPGDTYTFKPTETGLHKVGYFSTKDYFMERTTFMVLDLPFVDFYINSDQNYENGVPVTKVETSVPGTSFEWNFGNTTAKGRNAEGHFFSKGSYDITLTVTGANGCKNDKTESVYIEHEYGDRGNYNLLAPNAIVLNSTEEKNRTFMPDGLKSRDVKFRMVIYSTYDGHVVFETTDATKPWNGVDQATGRTVSHASTYHWEVTVENPMKGESPKYKGSLTVLNN